MLRKIFGATDDARLVPHRHPHRLGLVKLGVLEGRQPDQAIGQRLRQLRLLEINLVGQGHGQRFGHRPGQLGWLAFPLPRRGQIFVVDEGHVQRMDAARCPQDGRLDVVRGHPRNGCEKPPLVGIRPQVSIHEYAEPLFARLLLQWQGDQIAEAALRAVILIRKQPVVGREFQLPCARAGMADDGRTQTTRIPRRYRIGEKHPGVRALAGAGNLQRRGHTQFGAGQDEGLGILAPIGLVEIDRQEMAGVALQQRIDADCVLTGQMVVDHRIGQWQQHALGAIATLDARLLTDARAPLVGAGRGVARLAAGLAFPADRIHIGAAAKQLAEQRHLLVGGQPRDLRNRRRLRLRRQAPRDAVRVQQCGQARVFGAQRCQCIGVDHAKTAS